MSQVMLSLPSYPNLPLVVNKIDGPPWKDVSTVVEYSIDNNVGTFPPTVSTEDTAACPDTVFATDANTVTLGNSAADSDYPADYISQRNGWIKDLEQTPNDPLNGIPNPVCVGDTLASGTKSVKQPEASSAIDAFCGNKDYWDKQIVSPVSMTDGNGKAIGIDDHFPVNGGADSL